MKRILTAMILLPILLVIIKFGNAVYFFVICGIAASFASLELYRILEQLGYRCHKVLGVILSLGIAYSFLEPKFLVGYPIVISITLVLLISMIRIDDFPGIINSVMATFFPIFFIGYTLGYQVGLRAIPGEDGKDLLVFLFFVVWIGDSAAYYVGKTLGCHKMSPRISPNKTIEGAIGGILFSIVAALVAMLWFYRRIDLHDALILGLVLGVLGIFGDLAESAFKRAANIKDSSVILPGHGGFLDRFDSLLFTGPALYYYYQLFIK
ncbi:MAG: phosphatidate cytidylyltransferase [Acidobacteriota bacterium]